MYLHRISLHKLVFHIDVIMLLKKLLSILNLMALFKVNSNIEAQVK